MAETKAAHAQLKKKVVEETERMVVYTVYLSLVFGSFITYRRLILAEYRIDYFNYGYAVLEALILAKVILIGEAFHFGERYNDQPLIVPTLFKSLAFGVLFGAFFLLEHMVTGVIHHRDLAEIWAEVISKGRDEMVGRALMTVVAFIPFFAFRELERTVGGINFLQLFFRRREIPAATGRG